MTSWFLDRLRSFGERPAFLSDEQTVTYVELLQQIATWQEEIRKRDIASGHCVAIEGDYSPQSCALFLALVLSRAVAVPLAAMSEKEREESKDIAAITGVFTFAEPSQWSFSQRHAGDAHSLLEALRARHSPGLVLFSSGSTGKRKAILHDVEKLLKKFEERGNSMRTLAFLLFDHIGGVNTLLATLSGGGAIVTTRVREPQAVCRVIERHNVELLPTSPTFLNMVLMSRAYEQYDLSSLRLITYGTEPMPESCLQRLHAVLPQVTLKQTYGSSEIGIMRSKSEGSDSLWVKVGGDGFETKVVNGVLWVRSDSAMMGYLNAPSPFDSEGWINTGDIVEQNGEYVRFRGRDTDLINVGGEKVYPTEVESVLLQMNEIQDVTVSGWPNPVMGNVVYASVVLAQPVDPKELKARIRAHCTGRLAPFKIPMLVEVLDKARYTDRFKKTRKQ